MRYFIKFADWIVYSEAAFIAWSIITCTTIASIPVFVALELLK